MASEKTSNKNTKHSSKPKDYYIDLDFLRLGEILYDIATFSAKCGDTRPPDYEGENVENNTEH